jgi:anthranilate/para-aminobenzoate synthase component II
VKHKKYLIKGVQFHPESVMTKQGPQILLNFLGMIRK